MSSPLESRVEKDLAAITYSSGPTVKPQSRVEELLVALYNKIGPGGTGAACYKSSFTLSTTWTGSDPYYQVITLDDNIPLTENSKVDILLTEEVLVQLLEDRVLSLWVENNNGTLTAKALGDVPSVELTVPCTVMEMIEYSPSGSNVYFDPETNQLVFDDTSVYVDDDGYLVTNGTVDNDGYLNF